MNLFKQNHLKLNIKIITAALLLCLGSSLSTSITAADFLEETYEKHCERIRIIYINKDKLKKAEDDFRNTGSNSEKLTFG